MKQEKDKICYVCGKLFKKGFDTRVFLTHYNWHKRKREIEDLQSYVRERLFMQYGFTWKIKKSEENEE